MKAEVTKEPWAYNGDGYTVRVSLNQWHWTALPTLTRKELTVLKDTIQEYLNGHGKDSRNKE